MGELSPEKAAELLKLATYYKDQKPALATYAIGDIHALARGYLALVADNDAMMRELERHRHGGTLEPDFVCPDSLALAEARATILAMEQELDRYEERAKWPP